MDSTSPSTGFDIDRNPSPNCECGCSHIVLRCGVERCAACGKLAGRDAFVPFGTPLPARKAVRNDEHRFPPIRIYPTDRQEQLAVGASHLSEFADQVAERLNGVRSAIELVGMAQRSPELLQDADFAVRWKEAVDDLNELASRLGDDREYNVGYAAANSLALASGHERLVTGGAFTGDDLEHVPVPASACRIAEEIAEYGLVADSVPFLVPQGLSGGV